MFRPRHIQSVHQRQLQRERDSRARIIADVVVCAAQQLVEEIGAAAIDFEPGIDKEVASQWDPAEECNLPSSFLYFGLILVNLIAVHIMAMEGIKVETLAAQLAGYYGVVSLRNGRLTGWLNIRGGGGGFGWDAERQLVKRGAFLSLVLLGIYL